LIWEYRPIQAQAEEGCSRRLFAEAYFASFEAIALDWMQFARVGVQRHVTRRSSSIRSAGIPL
jgi:hypothetical protein